MYKVSSTQYAKYYATLAHAGAGRPKTGNHPSGITSQLRNGVLLDGMVKAELLQGRWIIEVDGPTFRKIKEILKN